jgi:hypothetical protein
MNSGSTRLNLPVGLTSTGMTLLEEPPYLSSDVLLVSLVLSQLQESPVILLALRENYAHYLSLSKKLGSSLEPHISSGRLVYYDNFMSDWCFDLPMTDAPPATFAVPSKKIRSGKPNLDKGVAVVVDAAKFAQPGELLGLCEEVLDGLLT